MTIVPQVPICRVGRVNETLRATITWVVQQVCENGKDADHVLAKLSSA